MSEDVRPKSKIWHLLLLAAAITATLVIAFVYMSGRSKFGVCNGQSKWNSPDEYLGCKYPDPPIGRWKAVYTKEFAKTHNLPAENISTDLSPGVEYMEMDVHPHVRGDVACLVNMLIQQPHDIAFFKRGKRNKEWNRAFNDQRTLSRFIDLEAHKDRLETIDSVSVGTRDGTKFKSTSGVPTALYAENVIQNYDFITADAGCYRIIRNPHLFPDNLAFSMAKASIWGKYETHFIGSVPAPQGREYAESRIYLNIPEEILSHVFKDMPMGGRK